MATERKERRKAGWLRRFKNEGPRDRAELVDALRTAARGGVIDADALQMIQGVLRVADLHVRYTLTDRLHHACALVPHDERPLPR